MVMECWCRYYNEAPLKKCISIASSNLYVTGDILSGHSLARLPFLPTKRGHRILGVERTEEINKVMINLDQVFIFTLRRVGHTGT